MIIYTLFNDKTKNKHAISKIYNIPRDKICNLMNKEWKYNLLGNDINDEGYEFIKID